MMVQVQYFVEGFWEPNEPMTLHWMRPFGSSVEVKTITTTNTTLPRYDDLFWSGMEILDREDTVVMDGE